MRERNPAFFVAGGTLRPDARCYVERRADRELLEALQASEFCYVLTSRQVGKSSLMVRTAARLRESGTRAVLLDLNALGQNLSPEQWYEGLVLLAGQQLDREAEMLRAWEEAARLSPLQRWRACMERLLDAPVVLFIDEIDAVRSLPFNTDEFFAAIRECYNARGREPAWQRLTFCLLGVAAPSDLIADPRITPFNIGRRIELTDFTPEEAIPLAPGLEPPDKPAPDASAQHPTSRGARGQVPNAQRLLSRILYWTGGHPYLTQRLCQAVAQVNGGAAARTRGRAAVDAAAADLFFSNRAAVAEANLLFVRDRLLHAGADLAALLELYDRVRVGRRVPADDTDPRCEVLRLSGVVRVAGGVAGSRTGEQRLEVRNRIYARVFDGRWVRAHMPGAELRRQRTAFRAGTLRAAAVSCGILALVSTFAAFAYLKEKEATDLTGRLRRSLSRVEFEHQKAAQEARRANAEKGRARGAEQAALRQQRRAELSAAKARHATALAGSALSRAQAAEQVALGRERDAQEARRTIRVQLVQTHVAEGTRLASEQDFPAALLRFTEALRLDRGDPEHEAPHRLRIASALSRIPRLVWARRVPPADLGIQPRPLLNGERVAVPMAGDIVRLLRADTGVPVGRPLAVPKGNGFVGTARGSFLATGPLHGRTLHLWSARDGTPLRPDLILPEAVTVSAASEDGRLLGVGCRGGEVRVFDTSHWRAFAFRRKGPISGLAFDATGKSMLVCAAGVVERCTPQGERQAVIAQGGSGSFSPDGRTILTGGGNGVTFWEPDGRLIAAASEVEVSGFTPDGRFPLLGPDPLQIWDPRERRVRGQVPPVDRFRPACLQWETPGHLTVVRKDGTVSTWGLDDHRRTSGPLRLPGPLSAACYLRRNRLLTRDEQGVLRLWDLTRQAPPGILVRGRLSGARVEVSADGGRALLVDGAGRGKITDIATGATTRVLEHGLQITAAAFSADGQSVATAGADRTLRVWSTRMGLPDAKPVPLHAVGRRLTFSSDARFLLVHEADGDDDLINLAEGRVVASLRGSADFRPEMTPDHSLLLIGVGNDSVRTWDLSALPAKPIRLARWEAAAKPAGPGIQVAALTPDGASVLLATDRERLERFDPRSGHRIGSPFPELGAVVCVQVSRDGRLAAVGNRQGAAFVWDLKRHRLVAPPMRHGSEISHLSFSPNGKRLLTTTTTGEVQIWNTATGEALTVPQPVEAGEAEFSSDGARIIHRLAGGGVRIWPVTPEARSVERLTRIAQALSGCRIDPLLGVVASAPAGSVFDLRPPAAGHAAPRREGPDLAWLNRRASELESLGDWAQAERLVSRALDAVPEDRKLRQERATVRIHLRDWRGCASDLRQLLGFDHDRIICFELALVCLAAGDSEGYRQACSGMLDRFEGSPEEGETDLTCWTNALSANSADNLRRAEMVMRRRMKESPSNPELPSTLGALLFRAGRYPEARAALESAISMRAKEAGPVDLGFLGAVLFRLGKREEGWKRVQTAVKQVQERQAAIRPEEVNWEERLETDLLCREFRILVGDAEPGPSH